MAEFDDKLNSILSNPDAMAQIMQLAQSLSGGTGGNNAANAPPPPPSQPGGSSPGWGQQPQTPPPSGGDPLSALAGGLDPQLLLRSLPLIQELGGARDSNAVRTAALSQAGAAGEGGTGSPAGAPVPPGPEISGWMGGVSHV